MPGFVGHTVTNSIALVGVSAFMAHEGWIVPDIAAVDAGILIATFALSPDMDLFTSKPVDGWGLMRYFWLPYSKLVKHRDKMHIPILGTTVRWIYLLAILGVLLIPILVLFKNIGVSVKFTFAGDRDDVIYYSLYLLDVYIGAAIADALHFALDMITHGLKNEPSRRRGRAVVDDESFM